MMFLRMPLISAAGRERSGECWRREWVGVVGRVVHIGNLCGGWRKKRSGEFVVWMYGDVEMWCVWTLIGANASFF